MKHLLIITTLFISQLALAQSVVGKWKTIDDNTGKTRSVVEIYEKEGLFYGKILKLFREPGEEQDPVCEECEDDRKGQKIIGMEIISEMKYNKGDNEYKKGEIMDPESGNIYDCRLWLEDNKLKVRGYLLFFYRTQTWLPYTGD
ncbi:MAG: DUF2147 domain-containing protein [Ekhidna sp.]